MKHLKTLAASAAVAFGLAAAPSLAQESGALQLCKGQPFAGNYIAAPHPTVAPVTADTFNDAAGEQIVSNVEPLSGNSVLLTPAGEAAPCDEFMKKIDDTGMVRYVEPNWMSSTGPVR